MNRRARKTETRAGFEPFTPHNKLLYHSYQLQDNFTMYLPQHSLTLGLSIEKYHSTNVFNSGAQSIYVYNSLADWYTDANDYLANPTRTVSPGSQRRTSSKRQPQSRVLPPPPSRQGEVTAVVTTGPASVARVRLS